MGYIFLVGFVFLWVCLGCGVGGALIYLFYLPFKKRLLKSGKLTLQKSRLINRSYIGLLVILAIFSTWTAFFPMNGFYIDEFELNTGLTFPDSGKIIDKDSCYPDLFGDYSASAVFEVNKMDFKTLKEELKINANFHIDTTNQKIGISREFNDLTKDISDEDIKIVFSNLTKEWFKVAFLKDGKTIIFERCSS